MKRTWIGLGLLAAILALSLWGADYMGKCHGASARDLNRSASLAGEGQWGQAEALMRRAEKNWQKKRGVTAAFADHEPMDEAEGLFAQLEVYARERDAAAFSAAAARLATLLQAIADAHRLNLVNLL